MPRRKRRTIEHVIRTRVNSANARAANLGVPGRLNANDLIAEWYRESDIFGPISKTTCPFCHRQLGVSNLSLDHIIPLSQGGTNHAKNIQWTCLRDNRYRGALEVEFYREFMRHLEAGGFLETFFQQYRPRSYRRG